MVRILQSVNIMDRAGLETVLMNYYRNMDRSLIQFDFLTHRKEKGAFDSEIESMGGKIYHAPRLYPQNYVEYFKYMRKFFGEHSEYKVIHSHIDAMSFFPLLAAQKSGVPLRIGHSHNTEINKDFKYLIKFFALKQMPKVANEYFACGDLAGKFMFPEDDFSVLHNAIDLEKYAYNEEIRSNMRQKLCVKEKFVIGHIGRYNYVKNQSFVIDIFVEILKTKPESVLLLIGKGEDEQKLLDKVKSLNLEEKVFLLKDRDDVDKLYQVMDVFVMPSLFEGLPVVAVESQANGLPCILSDKVSDESILSSSAKQLSLNAGAKGWAEKILGLDITRNVNATKELRDNGYDIKVEAQKLQDWYIKKYNEC